MSLYLNGDAPHGQFPGDRATRVSLLCHRTKTRFLYPPVCAHVFGRLVAEAHDARWRFSASATVGPLAESDGDR
jgi:hypothetical protein